MSPTQKKISKIIQKFLLFLCIATTTCNAMLTEDDPNIFNNLTIRAEITEWLDRHVFHWLRAPAINPPNLPYGGLGIPRNIPEMHMHPATNILLTSATLYHICNTYGQ